MSYIQTFFYNFGFNEKMLQSITYTPKVVLLLAGLLHLGPVYLRGYLQFLSGLNDLVRLSDK